jgi:hypothetical protein
MVRGRGVGREGATGVGAVVVMGYLLRRRRRSVVSIERAEGGAAGARCTMRPKV